MKVTTRRLMMAGGIAVLTVGFVVPVVGVPPPPPAPPWVVGDIFVSLSSGGFQVRDKNNPNTVKQTVDAPTGIANGATAGCAFDSQFNLLGAYFDDTKIVKFDVDGSHTASLFANPGLTSPSAHSQSIVFAVNGDMWVSNPDGDHRIHRYSSGGVLLQTYSVTDADGRQGATWLDLAANQHTMYFTNGGRKISTFEVHVEVESPDPTTRILSYPSDVATFAALSGTGAASAIRLLPTGGLLVADTVNIKRIGPAATYDASGADTLLSLNLDPDGVSFWAGDYSGKKLYKFAIDGTGSPVSTISLGGSNRPTGICVMGGAQLQIQPVVLKNISSGALLFDRTARFGDPSSFGDENAMNSFSTWRVRVGIQAVSGGIGAVSFTPQISSGICDGQNPPPSGSCSAFDLRFTQIANNGGTPTQCDPFFKNPSGTSAYSQTNLYECGQYRTKDLPESAYVPNTIQVILDLTNPPLGVLDLSLYGSGLKGNPRILKDPRNCAWATPGAQLDSCNSDQFIIDATNAVIDWPALTRSVPTSLADYSPVQRKVFDDPNISGQPCANIVKPDNFEQNSGASIKLIVDVSSACVGGVVQYQGGQIIDPITGMSAAITGANAAPFSMTLAVAGTGINQTLQIYCGTPGESQGCFQENQPGTYSTTVQLLATAIPPDAINPYVFAVTSVNDPSVTPDPLQQNPGLFPPTSRQYLVH